MKYLYKVVSDFRYRRPPIYTSIRINVCACTSISDALSADVEQRGDLICIDSSGETKERKNVSDYPEGILR